VASGIETKKEWFADFPQNGNQNPDTDPKRAAKNAVLGLLLDPALTHLAWSLALTEVIDRASGPIN